MRALAEESSTAERIAALHESFRYLAIAPTDASLVDAQHPLVVLERLTVTESMSRRALSKQIEDRWALEADDEFNWNKGGLLKSKQLGNFKADFGTWVTLGERTLGVNPSREIYVKVELLRLKW